MALRYGWHGARRRVLSAYRRQALSDNVETHGLPIAARGRRETGSREPSAAAPGDHAPGGPSLQSPVGGTPHAGGGSSARTPPALAASRHPYVQFDHSGG